MRPPPLTRYQSEQALRSPDLSKTAGEDDAGTVDEKQSVIPQAAQSAAHVAETIAEGVKTVVHEAVKWVEHKAEKLSEEGEEGLGPYGSPATCVPEVLDPLASGVMPAMEAERAKGSQLDGTPNDGDTKGKKAETESKEK
jgi:hypothetical protein